MISNEKINIDPINLKSIHLSIVSEDTVNIDWSYRLTFKDGTRGTSSNIPIPFTVSNPYPNPFKKEISFSVTMLEEAKISIVVFDLRGKQISYIYNGQRSAGIYKYNWNSDNVVGNNNSSGVYFIKITDGLNEQWKIITLVK